LRRAFLRKYLRRRPTRIEALALDRAALLSAMAEALASDPAVHPDTVTRADGAAARARAALAKLKPPKEPPPPSLQELIAAKLVAGGELVTNELIALNEAIASTLPAVKAKPIEVVFIDVDSSKGGRNEEMRLQEHIKELEQQLREARQHTHTLVGQSNHKAAVAPPAGQPKASQERSNVVPLNPNNGSLAVDKPLEERYPLRHLDPVT
jgi:hypothetical protein